MKTVTVMPSDNMIIVGGVAVEAVFSVEPNIHAIQWNEGKGHIEYVPEWQGQRIVPLSAEMYTHYVAPFVGLWEDAINKDRTSPPDVNALVEAKYAEIIEGANKHMARFKARYSCCEEETWGVQEAGARILLNCENLTKNSLALVHLSQEALREQALQLVADLAAEREIRPETMAERILDRADAMARYSQIIYGEQRKFERSLHTLALSGNEKRVLDLPVEYTPYESVVGDEVLAG